MTAPHVLVLGGGPAGVGAAFELGRRRRAAVTLVERQATVGGNAASFLHEGIWLDFGSHRLHSASDPKVLADIKTLLGSDLKHQIRRGRIRLRGRWLKFPLKPADLLFHLDRPFAFGILGDMLTKALGRSREEGDTFASVLEANLGRTICQHFYFPYARKIWGREPSELSAIQARKRVTAGSFGKLLKRLAKSPGAGRFYYPREGFGQISRAYLDAARADGADVLMEWAVEKLERSSSGGWTATLRQGEATRVLQADHVWSTIPVTQAARIMEPAPPEDVQAAIKTIAYQAMVLVYLELDVDRFTTTDAHYFPEESVAATRISEPKNYFGLEEPRGRTVLCAEVPCPVGSRLWTMTDEQIGQVIVDDLAGCGLPLLRPPTKVFTRRLSQAYPIYTKGYETALSRIDSWLDNIPGFLTYGRQGLFAHDNTHHALFMAYSAVDCLENGVFNREKWHAFREVFATHVVED